MSEEDALLAAIYANHDDDTPRLVYADWLDEHGQHERAELIRLPFELGRLEYYSWPWVRLRDRGTEIESKLRDQWLPHLDAEGKKRVRLWFGRGLLEVVRIEHGVPDDFRGLRALSAVRELWITDSALTEEAVREITTFEQLDELLIWGTTFQPEWLELLDCLPSWAAVQIDSSEAGFESAWEAFQQRRVARAALAPVERLRQMFRRRLGDKWNYREYLPPGPILCGTLRGPSEFDLAALSRIPELASIKLADGNESETGLGYLAQMPSLRSVELYRTEANTLTPLAACTRLERLHVTAETGTLAADSFEGLERLTKLQDLLLNGGPSVLQDSAFRRLVPLKQLRSLEIHFGELKEDSFAVLAGLSQLEILKLAGPTHDDDLRHLSGLVNLTCLVLTESQVTAAALRHLTRLTNLRTLFARGGGSQVTATAARQLADQLPNVTVLTDYGVVRTPKAAMTFRRRAVGDSASLLCPTVWAPPDYRTDYEGVWASEDGWEHIPYRLDDRYAEIVCYALGFASPQSVTEEVEEYTKDSHTTNPQILERSVVPLPSADAASCVWGANETQQVLCKVNLPHDCVTLIGRVVPARFEEFRSLFLFVARSLRVGADARAGVGEEVTVPVSEL
jgi:uncharacterized protein (TIGR02996 family)